MIEMLSTIVTRGSHSCFFFIVFISMSALMTTLARIVSSVALSAALIAPALASDSFRLDHRELAAGVHALIGPIGARTYENHGLNANFGVIDTTEGAVLIDSGASQQGAQLLEAEATRLTGKPVRWVINTGAQDHRWLGNSYFRNKGADVIALARTADTQQKNALAQLDNLRPVLKERLDGTEPVTANRRLEGAHETTSVADASRSITSPTRTSPATQSSGCHRNVSPSPATTSMLIGCWASCRRAMPRPGYRPSRD